MFWIRTVLITAAIALYGLSLAIPAFECYSGVGARGWEVLLMGWMAALELDFRWWGNPIALVMSLIVVANIRRSICAPRAAWLLLMPAIASALIVWSIVAPAYGCPGGDGAPRRSIHLAIGGYLWVSSILCASAAFCALYVGPRSAVANKTSMEPTR